MKPTENNESDAFFFHGIIAKKGGLWTNATGLMKDVPLLMAKCIASNNPMNSFPPMKTDGQERFKRKNANNRQQEKHTQHPSQHNEWVEWSIA